jgi:septal ring factor EnvC (AmiA/AmiB activator)
VSAEVSRDREKSANLASKLETVEEERKELAETVRRQKLELEYNNQMMSLLEKEKDQLSLQQFRQNNAFMMSQVRAFRRLDLPSEL